MEQFDLLRTTIGNLERLGLRYAVVGSWGSSIYGEPRFTNDIDIIVEFPEALIPSFCAAFPAPEFYWNEPAIRDAVRSAFQFNLLHPETGNKIDFMVAGSEGRRLLELDRRRRIQFAPGPEGFDGFVASPEDVIIGKLWYHSQGGGERHLRDVASILRVSGPIIDREFVSDWAAQLGFEDVWKQILAQTCDP